MATRPAWAGNAYVLLAAALAAGVVGGAGVALVWRASAGPATATVAQGPGCAVDQVAERALPSVVTINVAGGVGSGVVVRIAASTYIITNEHVISPASPSGQITVTYTDGRSTSGTLVGEDVLTDLAVVKPAEPSRYATPIPVADSDGLRVGQPVVALGSPLGLTSTVTSGIVSATDRYVHVPGQGATGAHLVGAIQTDAAINPGNSGGALVDCAGRLVGINTAGASPSGDPGSSGLGFAIPTALAEPLAAELVEHGSVAHPTLGLQVQEISEGVAAQAGVPAGLFVQAVQPGGPAAKAGLKAGDIVVEIATKPVRTPADLARVELKTAAGQSVPVTFERAGARSTVALTAQPAR